jgi:hypothetical protein
VVNVIGDIHKRRGEALRWLRIEYEVSFNSSTSSSASCASRRHPCSAVASSAAPGRPQRQELAIHAQDEEGDNLDSRIPSSSSRALLAMRNPSTACVSSSLSAMVSYSSDPYSSLRQDIDFILLLLLQNQIRSRGATVMISIS